MRWREALLEDRLFPSKIRRKLWGTLCLVDAVMNTNERKLYKFYYTAFRTVWAFSTLYNKTFVFGFRYFFVMSRSLSPSQYNASGCLERRRLWKKKKERTTEFENIGA